MAVHALRDDLVAFSKSSPDYTCNESVEQILLLAENVQKQQEKLEAETDEILNSLHDTFVLLNFPVPERTYPKFKRLSFLKSRENLESILARCKQNNVDIQLESIKECRKLLSGKL